MLAYSCEGEVKNGIYKNSNRFRSLMNDSSLSGSYGTPRMFDNSVEETSMSSTAEISEEDQSAMENSEWIKLHESIETTPKLNTTYVKPLRPKFFSNKSGTFPKVSPSRKVKNINIVFPTKSNFPILNSPTLNSPTLNSPTLNSPPLTSPTLNSPVPSLPKSKLPPMPLETSFDIYDNSIVTYDASIFNQTIQSSIGNILSKDDEFNTLTKGKKLTPTSCFKTSFANAISPKPFSKQIGTPFQTPVSNFNIRAHSTANGTERTLFTSALDKPTPSPRNSTVRRKSERVLNFSSDSISHNIYSDRKQSIYWLGEVEPYGPEFPKTCCHECGAQAPRIFAAVTTASPNNSKNISNELSNIIKTKQVQHGKNLAQEIIEEFKEKCSLKSKTSSPGTKNFVNRLVNDLGGNITEVSEIPDESQAETDYFDSDVNGSSSNEELNSAEFSTSISLKDSDSEGECAPPVTSTLKSNVDKSRFNKQPIRTDSTPFEEDGVFWIPVTLFNCPRTSTMPKRFGSRDRPSSISPITVLSDINQADKRIYQNFYEVSDYKQTEITKSVKTKKGRILDSGYSDWSNVNFVGSDSSTSDGSWSEDFDSSLAESKHSFSVKPISDKVFQGKKSGVYVR
ncbi:uncharacterized protein LOC117173038 isoform X2 [Belonocnema kinseyi]|uniref:uncharacterized protein LOC117173038 isoform X2 n=1 Tax=Belonocnema kinseyi TaxID=2817044 RepID=UPI00143D6981|nr:uncharacterized protein LOC117173038 isoform X2 [Belonocnema kinseyi]